MALPADLVREVLRRCDHETVIRCAASSEFLRSCMDDPAFLRRWAAAPSLLAGFFTGTPARFVESPTVGPALLGLGREEACCGGLPGRCWKPAACRGGLVVLKRGRSGARRGAADLASELCVREPLTGRRGFLPPQGIDDVHSVALLDATPTAAFQLVAVDLSIHTGVTRSQVFTASSRPAADPGQSLGAWGPVATAAVPADQEIRYVRTDSGPVAIGRTAYWLCGSDTCYSVLALHADEGRMRVFDGPWKYKYSKRMDGEVMLASTAGDDERQLLLSLVVLEERVIAVSVLPRIPDTRRYHRQNGWTRRAVIPRDGLPPQLRLDWFGERSGTLVAGVAGGARIVIALDGKEPARRLQGPPLDWPCCLYEMDLASLVVLAREPLPSSCSTRHELLKRTASSFGNYITDDASESQSVDACPRPV